MKKIFMEAQIYNDYNKYEWLRTGKNTFLRIDIIVINKNWTLAIEYDGEHHFMPIKHWGGEKKFKDVKRRDRLKNKLIKQNNKDIQYFVRFNYKEKITEEYVIKKLKKMALI